MKIDAVKCLLENDQLSNEMVLLNVDNTNVLKKNLEKEHRATVFIVRSKDFSYLLRFEDILEDRGVKQKTTELSKLVLGRNKIPFVDSNYSSSWKLLSGVLTLLANAEGVARDKPGKQFFIIGTNEEVFDKIWKPNTETLHARRSVTASTPPPLAEDDTIPTKTENLPEKERSPHKSSDGVPESTESFLQRDSSLSTPLISPAETTRIGAELGHVYIGQAAEVELVRRLIVKAGERDFSVLILGENGTGKQIVARQIHRSNQRRDAVFITCNCGAQPHELLESELFGHKKGALAGAAYERTGLWRQADKGTLFLDEVGELSPDLQTKVLQAIIGNKIKPVGETEGIPVDVRVIAASSKDLFTMVQTGRFREDLYYQLQDIVIHAPPLRDHIEDIPVMAQVFWKETAGQDAVALPADIIGELQQYNWPGNASELKTILTNLYNLFQKAKPMTLTHLRATLQYGGQVTNWEPLEKPRPEVAMLFSIMECIRHLKCVHEVITNARATIEPCVGRMEDNPEIVDAVYLNLQCRLDTIEMLCLSPLRFSSQPVYDSINLLKSRLLFFRELLKINIPAAQRHWPDQIAGTFRNTISEIGATISKLKDKAGKVMSPD
ncbi:MAG: hypothetical protein C0392_02615 [Syntrophus sp. (in: bacteria)]|nr:hypothetical protein [Syntrophus sp. (in: bacteria)]